MSERVTVEQMQACLDSVDAFSSEYYDLRLTAGEESDRNYALYGFRLPFAKVPQFVMDTMVTPPFDTVEYEEPVKMSVQQTKLFSNVHLFHDEALVIEFMRGFQNHDVRGTTSLRCTVGFPDSEGVIDAHIKPDISAAVRNYAQEQHKRAVDLLLYHSQLDVRLREAGLEPSEKTAEYHKAAAYVQYVSDNNIAISPLSGSLDLWPLVSTEEREHLSRGIVMNGAHADALHVFLGDLALFERDRYGYEGLGEEFGPNM